MMLRKTVAVYFEKQIKTLKAIIWAKYRVLFLSDVVCFVASLFIILLAGRPE